MERVTNHDANFDRDTPLLSTMVKSPPPSSSSNDSKLQQQPSNYIKSPPSSLERVINSDANILSHRTADNMLPPSLELRGPIINAYARSID